ncbi:protein of unknown function [Paraburkholderia kururiensis]
MASGDTDLYNRLIAAACVAVNCSGEFARGSQEYIYYSQMEAGATYDAKAMDTCRPRTWAILSSSTMAWRTNMPMDLSGQAIPSDDRLRGRQLKQAFPSVERPDCYDFPPFKEVWNSSFRISIISHS